MKDARFFAVLAVLVVAGLLLLRHGHSEAQVHSEPLSDVPRTIAGLDSMDQTIDSASLEVLGDGSFLSRLYSTPGVPQTVGLFIGYFPSQRTGSTMHSPKNCLPGAGWSFEESQYVDLADANGKPHRVGEYTIAEGDNRQFVIYWYQAHGRSVASEYMAKIYLVTDAIRMNRTDGALVRIITPIGRSEGPVAARTRAETFAAQLLPSLPRFIPD